MAVVTEERYEVLDDTSTETDIDTSDTEVPAPVTHKVTETLELSKTTKNVVALILVVIFMTLGGAAVYWKTAKVFECHQDKIAGFIPAGRTCEMVNRF